MRRRKRSVPAARQAILAFGSCCVVCGNPVRDLHHADHNPSNTVWWNLYPVCPTMNQGLERRDEVIAANADDRDNHLNTAFLARRAIVLGRNMRCRQAYACYRLAAGIARRLHKYDRAAEFALLALYVLRPVVSGDEWVLARAVVDDELLPALRLADRGVPPHTRRALCREFGAFFLGEYHPDLAELWLERGLSVHERVPDSSSRTIAARTRQHRGFARLRNHDARGIRDVLDAEPELALSHAPFGEVNDAVHLCHYYLDLGDIRAADKCVEHMADVLGTLVFPLAEHGDVDGLGQRLGKRMATGVIMTMARLKEAQQLLGSAEMLFGAFHAACNQLGVRNQGAILLPPGRELVPGCRQWFAALDNRRVAWLARRAERCWEMACA